MGMDEMRFFVLFISLLGCSQKPLLVESGEVNCDTLCVEFKKTVKEMDSLEHR
jgi:hypothetical protein